MRRNNLDMWDDAAPFVHDKFKTPEELEKDVCEADLSIKFFACTLCGAQKDERCTSDEDELDVQELPYRKWLEAFDSHCVRRNRWRGISDLEREMLKSVMDD